MLTIAIMKYPTFKIVTLAYKIEWFLYVLFPNFCLNKGLFDIYYNFQGSAICSSIDQEYNLNKLCSYLSLTNETSPCCGQYMLKNLFLDQGQIRLDRGLLSNF